MLAVRPYCNNKDYWQVYFDTNKLIKDSFTTAGFAVPEQHYMVRTAAAANLQRPIRLEGRVVRFAPPDPRCPLPDTR